VPVGSLKCIKGSADVSGVSVEGKWMLRLDRRLGIVVTFALAAGMLSAPPAAATAGATLPFSTFTRLAVDGAHGLEFVSGGPGTSSLAVFDTSGDPVTTIPMQGASGMALVGSNLYVAEADAPDIAIVDTSAQPPAVVGTLDVGTFTQPRDLTYVSGRLWFFTATGLGTVRPDGTGLAGPFQVGASYQPWFADGLTGGVELDMFDSGLGPATLYRYRASVPPIPLGQTYSVGGVSFAGQMAVLPGHSTMILAGNFPQTYPEIRSVDAVTLRSYAAGPPLTAVAISSAHGGMIAGGAWGTGGPDVWVYGHGQTTSFFTYDFGGADVTTLPRGIAWSADGSEIFVVVSGALGTHPTFNVVYPTNLPALQTPTLTVTPSSDEVAFGGGVDVAVNLTGGTTNKEVDLYSQPTGGARSLIGSGTVDGAGDLTATGFVPSSSTTLTASYAGDSNWGDASTSVPLDVVATTSSHLNKGVGRQGKFRLFTFGTLVLLSSQVLPICDRGAFSVELERNTGSGWRAQAAPTDLQYGSDGTADISVPSTRPLGRYRVRVVSDATPVYLGSTSTWSFFRFVT
jgi:hypothetical protein